MLAGDSAGEGLELAVEALEAGAGQGRAGALQMGLGQPVADSPDDRRHVAQRLVEEDMEVARRGAFAGQPLGFGRERAHDRPVDGALEQAEGRAQPAQRHPGLVDADRPAARQDDGAILHQVGMARRHDVPQRDIGGGIGGEPGVRLSHAGQTVTAGRDRATAKNDTLMKVLFQPSDCDLPGFSGVFAGRPCG